MFAHNLSQSIRCLSNSKYACGAGCLDVYTVPMRRGRGITMFCIKLSAFCLREHASALQVSLAHNESVPRARTGVNRETRVPSS